MASTGDEMYDLCNDGKFHKIIIFLVTKYDCDLSCLTDRFKIIFGNHQIVRSVMSMVFIGRGSIKAIGLTDQTIWLHYVRLG